jgi:aspartokinase-like uncharacterized kinase
MSGALVRVIKVGGSLFDWPELPSALSEWLAQQSPGTNYLLAGGGPWVEELRRAAATFDLSEEFCHRTALQLMRTSAAVLREVLRSAGMDKASSFILLDAETQLGIAKTLKRVPLPASWDVTSDSIAAHLAKGLQATELVLLKSAQLTSDHSLSAAAQNAWVDGYFPQAAAGLPTIRFVNLRSKHPPNEWRLLS